MKVKDLSCLLSSTIIAKGVKIVTSKQACTTYGLWAKCGPKKLIIWPAEDQKFVLLAFFLINLSLALGKKQKKVLARHEIWVVHPCFKERSQPEVL